MNNASSPGQFEALQCLVRHDAFDLSDWAMVACHTRDAVGFTERYSFFAADFGGIAALPQWDLDDLFVVACSVGDVPRAMELLDAGASILATARASWDYAVVIAGNDGNSAVVRALCDRPGALGDADAFRDDFGPFRDRAIIAAASLGDVSLARRLLQAGADIDAKIRELADETPLFVAAERGYLSMMRLLRDWGATFDLGLFESLYEEGFEKTSFSAIRAVTTFFVEGGMPFGNALHRLCASSYCFLAGTYAERPSVEKIKLLLELGADVNARYTVRDGRPEYQHVHKTTPLLAAIRSGHVEHVTLILTAGADPLDCGDGEVAPLDAVSARVSDARAAKAMRAVIQLFIAGRDE